MSDEITVLLTACGTKTSPGIIHCLRKSDHDFRIIGTDMQSNTHGKHFVDEYYTVPDGLDPNYTEVLLEIATGENVDVISPLSDEEVVTLSKSKQAFEDHGIAVVCSDEKATTISNNKGEMLEFLSETSIEIPEYGIPNSITELDKIVSNLGYPNKEVVFKPTTGRGGRGFWILSDDVKSEQLLYSRNLHRVSYDWIREQLQNFTEFPNVLVMEYLSGIDYNLDALADNGEAIYTIPIERIEPEAGPVQTGRLVHDEAASEMATKITDAFGFDYNINIEMAYRDKNNDGKPLVYEINPRVSGPIAAHTEGGVDMFLYGILLALDQDIPRNLSYDEITMRRYWQEIYEY